MEELLLEVMPDKEARKLDLSAEDILKVIKLKLGLSDEDDIELDELEELLLRRRGQENPFAQPPGGPPPPPPGPGAPDPTFGRQPQPGGSFPVAGASALQAPPPNFLPPEVLFDLAERMRRRRRSSSSAPFALGGRTISRPPGGPGF